MTQQPGFDSDSPERVLPNKAASWGELLSGTNLIRSVALSGGVVLHAVNLYIATTILPSVVKDIGGIDYYAWNTTIYVVASIVAAALSARVLTRLGPKMAYVVAGLIFAVGAVVCATAASMPWMLNGRLIQGFGGGLLVSLPYAMTRIVFPERLWSRAMAMISGMWGIATLFGPALGGIFAELGIWRMAFWSLLPLIIFFAGLAAVALPPRGASGLKAPPLPARQLILLTLAVLAASIASVSEDLLFSLFTLVGAGVLTAILIYTDKRAPQRLLPRGSFQISSPVGALYAMSALLAATVGCTEIFIPLFLQELQGFSPLKAGYFASLMSIGWTTGALLTSSLQNRPLRLTLRASPALSLLSLAALAVVIPWPGSASWTITGLTCAALILGGMSVGLAFPHLASGVLLVAPPDEQELAASSIMTVQLSAIAFGAALAGLTVNLAGISAGAAEMDVANAARWLFIVFLVAPAVCFLLMWNRTGLMMSTPSPASSPSD